MSFLLGDAKAGMSLVVYSNGDNKKYVTMKGYREPCKNVVAFHLEICVKDVY